MEGSRLLREQHISEDPTALIFREEAEAVPAEADFPEWKSTKQSLRHYKKSNAKNEHLELPFLKSFVFRLVIFSNNQIYYIFFA
ncbi:hypothetical protein [Oceanobacillus massiliensis]|uniref:hypothetical protein n=1 Tax=Oceanobacillus massiliensis TaxID=1465765 RepID=UPI0005CB5513|nr:hypothetical protein [Oceanobacillus massiliensis]